MKIKKVYIRPQSELLDMEIQQLCLSVPTDGKTDDNGGWSRGSNPSFKDESEETDETGGVIY